MVDLKYEICKDCNTKYWTQSQEPHVCPDQPSKPVPTTEIGSMVCLGSFSSGHGAYSGKDYEGKVYSQQTVDTLSQRIAEQQEENIKVTSLLQDSIKAKAELTASNEKLEKDNEEFKDDSYVQAETIRELKAKLGEAVELLGWLRFRRNYEQEKDYCASCSVFKKDGKENCSTGCKVTDFLTSLQEPKNESEADR